MHKRRRNIISRLVAWCFFAMPLALLLSSCESFFEYLDPCPHGVSLRFVYDYNMEYANAFPKKVDCLTLLVYDEDGVYVGTHSVTGNELQDETFRMQLDLDSGTYHFVAYGGMACNRSSFVFETPAPAEGVGMEETKVVLNAALTEPVKSRLHDMFYGSLTLETGDLYREGTVEMMKNTNNIRVVLQQMNGQPVHAEDFGFRITDDNTLFAWDNRPIPNGEVVYEPWTEGEASTGVTDNGEDVVVAYAEFSVSRLFADNSPKLIISNIDEGKDVVNIPLNNYLLMLKSELYAQMSPQEFLDRESEWSLVFFLDENGMWLKTFIKINDWTVRLNDTDF